MFHLLSGMVREVGYHSKHSHSFYVTYLMIRFRSISFGISRMIICGVGDQEFEINHYYFQKQKTNK